jgi:hypothetical protein
MQVIDRIPAAVMGAPDKLIGIDNEGQFGLVAFAPGVGGEARFTGAPFTISQVIEVSRGVVSGDSRAVTSPGTPRNLAIGVIAVAAQLGRVSIALDTVIAENRRLRELCAEAKGALWHVDGQAELCERLGDVRRDARN